ncbi:MAG: signal transduction histidine kinase, partial [Acidimicrobiales bacterium]|nr:signal transduction histidine kinase [Acidimicrobiales bacterium]
MLDTAPEQRFDRLTDLASIVLGVPIALVSLIGRDRQWFKSRVGLEVTETSRDISFCAHAILLDSPGLFTVEDTFLDARFADNPLVTGAPWIRFYAGQVLRDPDGHALGTMCAIDRTPRTLDADQRRALSHLAALAEQELNRRSEMQLLVDLDVGERKKALILDVLGEGVLLQDANGSIVEWNPAAERLLGLSGDELSGRTSTDPRWAASHADGSDWPGETHPPMEVLRTGQAITDVVMGIHRPHADRVWLRLSSQPILDRTSGARQVLTVFADVTAEVEERAREHELEQALARSEQTSRVSLDSLEQGVILADLQGEINRINPAAVRLLGHSAAELTALWQSGDWLIFDEAGMRLPRHRHPLVRVAETGQAVIGETVGWRRPDGTRILLRLSCVPNADGDERLVITFTDITEDRLAQRVLDATLDTAPVGLAILDTDRSILRCNSTFAEQAGRPAEELVGMDVVSLIHFDHRPDASAVGNHLRYGTRSKAELEQCVVRPDGTEIWVNTHLAVIPDPDRPLAIAATFDVTEQRRLLLELTRFGYMFEHAND